jgi:hypothetical protein
MTERTLPAAERLSLDDILRLHDTESVRVGAIRKTLERLRLRAPVVFEPLKVGSICIHCGNPWLPAPGGGIYHECHT